MLFGKIPLPDWFSSFYNENKRGFLLLYALLGLLFINFFIVPVKKKNPQEQNLNVTQQQTVTDTTSSNNNQQVTTNTTSQTEQLQNNQNQTTPQPLTPETNIQTATAPTTTSESDIKTDTTANTNTASGVLTTNTANKMKVTLVDEDIESGKIDPYRPLIVTEETTVQQTTVKVKTPVIKKIKVKPPKYNGYLPPIEIPTPGTIPTPVVVEVKKPATIKVSGVAVDSQPTAIISDGNKDYIVKEGGNVAGYKVVSISSKKIILMKKGRRKELKVGG